MNNTVRIPVFLFFVMLLLSGIACSKGHSPVTLPDISQTEQISAQTSTGGHHLLSYSIIFANPDTMEFTLVPARAISTHFNILNWLEKDPCTDCVTITKVQKLLNNNFLVSLRFTHPFPSTNVTAFDVRGIMMFHGSQTYPVTGLTASNIYKNDSDLMNPDGYTALYNFSTAGQGYDGLQGYQQGDLAFSIPNTTVNGYKMYYSDIPSNLRHYFIAGSQVTADFEIHFSTGTVALGYAVDASWAMPFVIPVTDPLSQFPPEANCPEPWQVVATEDLLSNTLTSLGGSTTIAIDVYDYLGMATYKTPTVECPDLFTGLIPATFVESLTDHDRWTVTIPNSNLVPGGQYRALIKVEDNDNDTAPSWLDLSTYQIVTLAVTSQTTFGGWAVTFGGDDWDTALSSVADSQGNVYVTGAFSTTCNFDPNGSAVKTSQGGRDAYLAKYDSNGNFVWVNTWGGTNWEMGVNVALNGDDVLCYGYYEGTVDFSGGSGTDVREAIGNMDYFLSSYNASTGVRKWTATWGSNNYDYANGLGVDFAGNIYLGGTFGGKCDFDPGSAKFEVTPIGYDAFLLKLNKNSGFQWVRTWGADTGEDMKVTDIATTPSGETWMCGYFWDTADFDPGAGIDIHTSTGQADCWASRFDQNGNFKWARTWGNPDSEDKAYGIEPDFVGNSYITGEFRNTVDFDPGAGVQNLESAGLLDAFLLELDISGNYVWCGAMGGEDDDSGRGVTIESFGNILAVGEFSGNANVSPTEIPSYRNSNGSSDVFLSKISQSHEFLWGDAWGGTDQEHFDLLNWFEFGNPVSVDIFGKVYVCGEFSDVVNFNPNNGDPADNHTSSGSFDAFITTIPPNGTW
ncbi:MAG: hypothetical protein NTY09_06635 [bacterium]|nr:hypothetical protein [bacterium]